MLPKKYAQSTSGLDTRNHPERMPEHLPPFRSRERIPALRIIDRNQIQKPNHIVFVNKIANLRARGERTEILLRVACPGAEELREVKRRVEGFIPIGGLHSLAQVKRQNPHFRQVGVWIVVAGMYLIPFSLTLLFHHVIPGVDVFLILPDDIIRSARQGENFGSLPVFLSLQSSLHSLSQIRLRSLMGFVVDNQIPVHLEDRVVFVVLAAYRRGVAQVLDRGEIHKRRPGIGQIAECAVIISVNFRVVQVLLTGIRFAVENTVAVFAENKRKILPPSVFYSRTVGYNDDFLIVFLLNQAVGRNRLAKPHFTVPEHLILLPENRPCSGHAVPLFLPQDDGLLGYSLNGIRIAIVGGNLPGSQGGTPLFHRLNRQFRCVQVNAEPLAVLIGGGELDGLIPGGVENIVNIYIAENSPILRSVRQPDLAAGKFRMKEIIVNQGSFRVLVNASSCRAVEFVAVWRELFVTAGTVKAGFSDFQTALMFGVRDGKHINQLVADCCFIALHEGRLLSIGIDK